MLYALSPVHFLHLPRWHPPVISWLPRPVLTAISTASCQRVPLFHTATPSRPFADHDDVINSRPNRALIPSASTVAREAVAWDGGGDVASSWPSNPVEIDDGEPLASESTLVMLEWPRVCETVAGFASTATGKQVARNLEMPTDQRRSETLLAETHAALAIESRQSGALVFSGINTQLVRACHLAAMVLCDTH